MKRILAFVIACVATMAIGMPAAHADSPHFVRASGSLNADGSLTVSFKEAVLSLTVTPQITPDDRIIMDLTVTKDSVGEVVSSGQAGGFIPSIDTRELVTQVHVNDGETVVLGGVYETELRNSVNKVPGLGNIPGLGYLFRNKTTSNNNAELLIFVTPKILRDGARVE